MIRFPGGCCSHVQGKEEGTRLEVGPGEPPAPVVPTFVEHLGCFWQTSGGSFVLRGGQREGKGDRCGSFLPMGAGLWRAAGWPEPCAGGKRERRDCHFVPCESLAPVQSGSYGLCADTIPSATKVRGILSSLWPWWLCSR